jgi:hypothetical protein
MDETTISVLQRDDKAMYIAKRTSKNRVGGIRTFNTFIINLIYDLLTKPQRSLIGFETLIYDFRTPVAAE